MSEDLTLAKKALDKTKIRLMSSPNSTFFTVLCLSMEQVWDSSIATAACNGKKIFWNPEFFMSLVDIEERVFVMVHEVMHSAYLHIAPTRIAGRNHLKWNAAADYVINLQLVDAGFRMPTGKNRGLLDEKYRGMSVEQVYALLPDSFTPPTMDDLLPPEGDLESFREDVQNRVMQAVIQSKLSDDAPGSIPGGIEIFLDKLLNPILPAARILQKYLLKYVKNDYTFKRPNRRFFPKHFLPTILGQSMIDITIAVDTSGSVTDQDFHRIISEVHNILKKLKPKKTTFIQFDSTIKSVDNIASTRDLLNVEFSGRGGTRIAPVVNHINTHLPQLVLIFTDGDFNISRGLHSNVDTIWLIHNNKSFSAPWGKAIHYDI